MLPPADLDPVSGRACPRREVDAAFVPTDGQSVPSRPPSASASGHAWVWDPLCSLVSGRCSDVPEATGPFLVPSPDSFGLAGAVSSPERRMAVFLRSVLMGSAPVAPVDALVEGDSAGSGPPQWPARRARSPVRGLRGSCSRPLLRHHQLFICPNVQKGASQPPVKQASPTPAADQCQSGSSPRPAWNWAARQETCGGRTANLRLCPQRLPSAGITAAAASGRLVGTAAPGAREVGDRRCKRHVRFLSVTRPELRGPTSRVHTAPRSIVCGLLEAGGVWRCRWHLTDSERAPAVRFWVSGVNEVTPFLVRSAWGRRAARSVGRGRVPLQRSFLA